MRRGSNELVDLLTASFTRDVVADIWLGTERVASRLRVTSWGLDSALAGDVKTTGHATIVHESESGESLRPDGVRGPVTPFGSMIELLVTISAGFFSETITMGRFRVTRVVSAEDTYAEIRGRRVVVATVLEVEVASLDEPVRRRGLQRPTSPPTGGSCWGEMRVLTGMPVVQDRPDVAIPAGIVWDAVDGSRLAAVQDLAGRLGGVAVVDSEGAWRIIPDEIGDPVASITVGEDGTLLSLSDELTPDGVDNEIIGVFSQGDRGEIVAQARVTAGPLAVTGPYGTSTRYVSSTDIQTADDASTLVQRILAQATSTQQQDMAGTAHFHPLIEIGDVIQVTTDTETVVGRVTQLSISDAAVMNFTIRTWRDIR